MEYDYIECGDCCELMKKLPDKSVDCILTDPPYLYLKNQKLDRPFDEDKYFKEVERILKDEGFIVMFGRGTSFYRWNTKLVDLGFEFKEEIIWNKRQASNVVGAITRIHETISIHTKKGKLNNTRIPYIEQKQYDIYSLVNDIKRIKGALNNPKSMRDMERYLNEGIIEYNEINTTKHEVTTGIKKSYDRAVRTLKMFEEGLREKSIIECKREHYKMQHPTQKPVRLLERLINLTTNENNLVLDTFMGSGSTCVACLNTNRHYIGFELRPEYFEIAKARLEGLTKQDREQQEKGQTTLFDFI